VSKEDGDKRQEGHRANLRKLHGEHKLVFLPAADFVLTASRRKTPPWTGNVICKANQYTNRRLCNRAWGIGVHKIQDHAHRSLISAAGIDHGMVDCAIRPFHLEVFLDEIGALVVDRIDELTGFALSFAAGH